MTHGEERVANSSSGSIAQELTSEGIRQYIFTGSHIGKAKVGSTTPTVTFFVNNVGELVARVVIMQK